MRTVKEVSGLTGVSIRALHHYDSIGLLRPTQVTESGYRLYDDEALEKLQMILLFKELKFLLKEIKKILDNPSFDRKKALEQQIRMLTLQKEHIQGLICLAREIQTKGVEKMFRFDAFNTQKMDEYARQAKAEWGNTEAYREFEEKSKNRTARTEQAAGKEMMDIFREFGALRENEPRAKEARELVQKLRDFITENFYQCTPEILRSLGEMYVCRNDFTDNIDAAGGEGTAGFVKKAIDAYCGGGEEE